MTRFVKKQLRIFYERLKVPRQAVRLFFHITGQYKQGLRNAHDIQFRRVDVELPRLPNSFDGFRILLMGDLHIDSRLHLFPRIKNILSTASADVVLLLGDYRYRLHGSVDLVLKRMQKIADLAASVAPKIYAIRGNHDTKELMRHFEEMSITVLNNEHVRLDGVGGPLYIVGVDEPHYDKEDDLPGALAGVSPDACKILLAHTSEIYRQAADLGIDLYLCGHTHGGQINVKGIGPVITNVKAPRRFARDLWSWNGMSGFTTTGVGASAVPIRFNCPPEIVLLTLRKETHAD